VEANAIRGETLELLLTVHFPNSEVTEEMADPAAAGRAGCSDWRVAASVVTYRRVEWAIDCFAPYRSPGKGGILLDLLQEGRRLVVLYLVRIFRACLATDHVPAIWYHVIVCLYLIPVGIPIADLGILDLTVSHRSHLRPWRGW